MLERRICKEGERQRERRRKCRVYEERKLEIWKDRQRGRGEDSGVWIRGGGEVESERKKKR